MNGFLILSLLDLGVLEAASLIKEAFFAHEVDYDVMGDWEDAQIGMGLSKERLILSLVDIFDRKLQNLDTLEIIQKEVAKKTRKRIKKDGQDEQEEAAEEEMIG